MILGRVVGTVWATRKNPHIERLKLAIVQPHFWYRPSHEIDHVVAVDQLGADPGQDVVVCMGQPGRWVAGTSMAPVEASIMAIVDRTEIASESIKDKQVPFQIKESASLETLVWTERGSQAEDRQA